MIIDSLMIIDLPLKIIDLSLKIIDLLIFPFLFSILCGSGLIVLSIPEYREASFGFLSLHRTGHRPACMTGKKEP